MLVLRGLIGIAIQVTLIGAALLLPAGTWDWPRAIQFLVARIGLRTGVGIAVVVLARIEPEGLEARLAAPLLLPSPWATESLRCFSLPPFFLVGLHRFGASLCRPFSWLVFIRIDVFRLQLLTPPSLAVSIVGAVVCMAGFIVILVTIYQNAFAAPIVKDQSERGQTLVDTGLHNRIRHPMYNGLLLWLAGLALWLKSNAAAIGVLALVLSFWAGSLRKNAFCGIRSRAMATTPAAFAID